MPTSQLHRIPTALVVVCAAWCSSLSGQWRVGAELGATRFWGGSIDTDGNHTSIRPYRPTTFGLGIERQSGRYAVGLQVQYADAGLALEGPDLTIAAQDAFTIVTVSPELAVRVATVGAGNQIRLHAGPVIEHWDLVDSDGRTRVGAQGAVSFDVPLGQHFGGTVLAGGAVTASPYQEGELDTGPNAPTYDLRTLWRRRFALGLTYRL
jgi:hypothetical protein